MSSKYVEKCGQLPGGDHYAILLDVEYYDGDYMKKYVQYFVFTKREEWEAELKRLALTKPLGTFQGVYVRTAKLAVEVTIS